MARDFGGADERERTAALEALLARGGYRPGGSLDDARDVIAYGESVLGEPLADAGVVHACAARSKRCLYVRRSEAGALEGFMAVLHLNEAGAEAMLAGRFDAARPALDQLANPDEPAAAIYLWCIAAVEGEPRRGLTRAIIEARRTLFPNVPVFGKPSSREGRELIANFAPRKGEPAWLGWIPLFEPDAAADAPEELSTLDEEPFTPAQPVADDGVITVRVARSFDDLQKVFAVRALVYIREQDCPYEEEYDGNDLAGATHLLAEREGEPVGCLRIRWFRDFAKIERVAVRRASRSSRVARLMMAHAIEILRRKGHTHLIGHVQEHLVPYWRRYGLKPRAGRPRFVFSDRAYIEVEAFFEPHPRKLSERSPPLVLDRPEGDWDEPGPLDRSTTRGVAPPASSPAPGQKADTPPDTR